MSLVSGLYRLIPSEGVVSDDERRRRMRRALQRVVQQYGMETVRKRVAAAEVSKEEEAIKAFILLHL